MVYTFKNMAKSYFALILLIFSISFPLKAMKNEEKLFSGIHYKEIFNQQDVLSMCPNILKKEGHEKFEFTPEQKGVMTKVKGFINWLTCGCLQLRREKKLGKQLKKYNNNKINIDDKASSEILDKALVENYQGKKTYAMKRALVKTLLSCGIKLSTFAIVWRIDPGMLGKGIMAPKLFQIIQKSAKKFYKAGWSIFISPLADQLEEHEKNYAKRKRFLSEALQKKIEGQFCVARKSDHAIESVEDFANIALNLPLKSKKLKPLSESEKEVNELLEGYDRETAEIIKLKLFNHYNRFSNKAGPLESPKSVLFLIGPPAVGKTHTIQELADLMGAKLIKLTDLENVQSIIGSEKKPGSFLSAICDLGTPTPRNAIILIDEIDHVVNKENSSSLKLFLPLLDPATKYFKSPYLKTKIDISHFCFVLCGNSALKNEALKSRVTKINYKDLKKVVQKKIIYKMLSKKIKENIPLMNEIDKLIEASNCKGVRKLKEVIIDKVNMHLMAIKDPLRIKILNEMFFKNVKEENLLLKEIDYLAKSEDCEGLKKIQEALNKEADKFLIEKSVREEVNKFVKIDDFEGLHEFKKTVNSKLENLKKEQPKEDKKNQ
ncbi:AAA family ATPase [Candidatus Dependentiae bacterium]